MGILRKALAECDFSEWLCNRVDVDLKALKAYENLTSRGFLSNNGTVARDVKEIAEFYSSQCRCRAFPLVSDSLKNDYKRISSEILERCAYLTDLLK